MPFAGPVAAGRSGEERQGGTCDGEWASRTALPQKDRPAPPLFRADGGGCDYEAVDGWRGEGESAEPPDVMAQRLETRPLGNWFEAIGTFRPIEEVGAPNPVQEATAQFSQASTRQGGAEAVERHARRSTDMGRCGP